MITLDCLRTVPLLVDLSETELLTLASMAADVSLNPGEWLVHEGDPGAFFILLAGNIEVFKNVGGVQHLVTRYEPGDYSGEIPLLLGSSFIAGLRAANAVRVLRLDGANFQALIARSEKLAVSIIRTMTERVSRLRQLALDAPVARTIVVGFAGDVECYNLRQFLSGNQQDFQWIDPSSPDAPQIPAGAESGPYPAVVLADGAMLNNPSPRELAERLGLQTAPTRTVYDVVIVGGGPAGLAAAVYGASEGLHTLLLERQSPGGQAGTSSRIENYLGFPNGLSGGELAARALQQARRFGTEFAVARTVKAIDLSPDTNRVVIDGDESVEARTIILATGVSWRSLAIPGADALVGKGVYYGAARTEALGVRGKDVFLIGGGNSAGQAAMFFADYARQVTLLIRGTTIEAGMSQYLIDQLATKTNVSVELNASVVAVSGEERLEAITVRHSSPLSVSRTSHYATDSLFVFIGADAQTDWLPDGVARDERGYIATGEDVCRSGKWPLERDPFLLETSAPGVFAAGDVRHGSIKRVASGVGEGSMAIAFVHQYLALDAGAASASGTAANKNVGEK